MNDDADDDGGNDLIAVWKKQHVLSKGMG